MKIFVLSLLAVFALGSAQDCSDERVEACFESLILALSDDSPTREYKLCGGLQTSIVCLRNAVDECLEEEDEYVEEGFEQLEELFSDNCEQALGSAQDCSDERVEACYENLISAFSDDTPNREYKLCGGLQDSIICLRNAVDECLEEVDEYVEERLEQLEEIFSDNCEQGEVDEKIKKCFQANRDNIIGGCLYEEGHRLNVLAEMGRELNENELQCLYNNFVKDCSMERAEKRCGDAVASLMKKEFDDVEACEKAGEVDEGDEILNECFKANEDYIYNCLDEGMLQMLNILEENGELNENEQRSEYNSFVDGCFVERAKEKCGDKGASIMKKKYDDVPADIVKDYEEAGEVDEGDEMIKKCFEANIDNIIVECLLEGSHHMLNTLAENGRELNEIEQLCLHNSFVEDCSMERAEKKCGVEVASLMKKEFDIVEACEKDGEVDEGDEIIKECFEANKDYIYDCLYEGALQMLNTLAEKCSELNENEQKCVYHSFVMDCSVERAEETCGDEVASIMKKKYDDVPAEIVEACEKAGNIDQHYFQLLDKKKK